MVGIHVDFKTGSSMLKANGFTVEEEAQLYDDLLQDVIENPRWYLNQLDYMREFRVSWTDYRTQNVTKPYRFLQNPKLRSKKSETFINKTTPI